MSVRFLADHCVSNYIMQTLRDAGHDVHRLKDHVPADSPDPLVIATAVRLDAILVSLNGDFSDIVTYPPERYHGILAIQVHNHPETIPKIMARVMAYVASHPDMSHYKGKLLLAEPHRIRIRM
ncbi:MAG: DUF5615 family PIN-like protein [Nitrospirota bacterium]